MDVTLKKSVLEMGIPLQSAPPHYYSLGVVRRMNFLGNYFGLYFFLHALKNRVEQHDVTPKTVKCFCVGRSGH